MTTATQSNLSFLEKVMARANLTDIYEAREMTEIVYRTMRDLVPTKTIDNVASELNTKAVESNQKQLEEDIADLWKDTNPIVAWISRIRSPLDIDDQLFIRRVEQEGAMPERTTGEIVVKAVFAATKEELSQERITELSGFLPGKIKEMWEQA
ncbi:hypothetical protein cce_4171 [Crocosphaera subtropica ATCC 51142]|uniref:Uncharacterized protein n=1 Tax=Crocosphaera subtropica (strain ATCC 51142 / BH68) TaxID=43989 RepID=B1WRS8_CROS5|nr:DUF2267 domain-containing protein [Crocosphaera subtropica]ACB53519.1 hypothetical protein cce_4171 [Crocosphaera subtropica ATCC 51142]